MQAVLMMTSRSTLLAGSTMWKYYKTITVFVNTVCIVSLYNTLLSRVRTMAFLCGCLSHTRMYRPTFHSIWHGHHSSIFDPSGVTKFQVPSTRAIGTLLYKNGFSTVISVYLGNGTAHTQKWYESEIGIHRHQIVPCHFR